MRIAVDAMGGDFGPDVTVPACVSLLEENHDVSLVLTGDQSVLIPMMAQYSSELCQRIKIHHTSEVVEMDESPSSALRNKKDSSLRVALNLLLAGDVDACVSAGNTGALMATAKFVLKMIPGISRPAILTRMPTESGAITRVLDLGANVDSSAEQLVQFAIMGSILAEAVGGVERPRVGLLNIGEEDVKGSQQIRQAAELLQQIKSLNYIGFVEGNDWFSGRADVVACDGLVGNIALKAVEGVSSLIANYLVGSFKRNIFSQLSGILAKPTLSNFKNKIDSRNFNGATLVGVNGVVIKSHGSADEYAFKNALCEAMLEVEKNVPALIAQKLGELIPLT